MCLFFREETPVYVGPGASGILTPDLNADGHTEVVVVDKSSQQLVVLTEDGHGSFSRLTQVKLDGTPSSATVSEGGTSRAEVIVAVGTDGNADLVAADGHGGFQVTKAPGLFPPGQNLLSTRKLSGGGEQVVVVNVPSATLHSDAKAFGLPGTPNGLVTADLTHAGTDSAVVTSSGGVSVLLAKPNGDLAAPTTYLTPHGLKSVVAADMNGDGSLDLVVASAARGATEVSVLQNDGTGHFGPARPITLDYHFRLGNPSPPVLTATHLNGQKFTDIVLADTSGIYVLFGDGHGGFGQYLPLYYYNIYVDGTPMAITATSLTASGRPDLLITYKDGTMQVIHTYLSAGFGAPLHTPARAALGPGAGAELLLGLGLSLAIRRVRGGDDAETQPVSTD